MSTLRRREFPRGRRGGVARIAVLTLALASPGAAGAGWEQIAAGSTHSCGIAEGGRVICWGASSAGQTSPPDVLMRQVVSGRDFSCALAAADGAIDCWGAGSSAPAPGAVYAQISAGDAFACGLRLDSTLECWGSNADGQLNVPAGRYTRVSAGAAHACARRESGAIDCWGADVVGQASPPGGGFLELTAGRRHSCALDALGVAHCWGLGVGAGAPAAAGFQQISAGDEHTCALRADATLECWGADGAGQASPPAGTFRSVHAGSSHTCGIRSDGRAECWGRDDDDQASPPEPVAPGVAAGGAHSCALRADGRLDCWGLDAQEQATPPAGAHVALDAGASHGCAVRSDGGVTCWGDDAEGQVSGAATAPAPFHAVTTGRDHSCALSDVDGMPHCWGSDALGQLQAPALRLESIDAGSFHSCGIGDQGAVHCWGFDGSGQASPPADPMTRVSAGSAHSCGIRATDRRVICWGLDDDGQSSPPPGPFIAVSAGRLQSCGVRLDGVAQCWGATGPGDPPDLRFVDVSVGGAHACGLTTDGAVACWGDASLGQLSSVFDDDDDGVESLADRCPADPDPAQLDTDADGAGDVCDVCPGLHDPDQADSDGDKVGDLCDNCVDTSNPLQLDTVGDGRGGNACRPVMLRLHPAEISTELTRYRLSVRCGSFDVARLRFGVFYPQSVAPADVDFGDGCDDVEGCSVAQGLGDTVDPFNSTVRGPGLDEVGIRDDVQYVVLSGVDNAAGVPALCSGGDFSEVFLADLLVAGVHDFGIPFMLTLQGLDLIGGVFSEGGPIGLPDGTPGDPTAFMMTSGDIDAEVAIEIRPAVADNTGTLWDVFLFSEFHEVNELRVGYTGVPNQPASSLLVVGCETFTGGAANERSCAQVPDWPAAADAPTSSTVGPDPGGSTLARDDTLYAELFGALPGAGLTGTLNYPGLESWIGRVQDLPPLGQLAQPPVLTFDGASSAHGGGDAIVVDASPVPVTAEDVAFINAFTPGTDFDGDLQHNSSDNCPHIANPGQEDNGSFMSTGADGTGDHCECGESTDNGAIFADDLSQLRQGLAGDPMTAVPTERCSLVGDPASCDMADVVALSRALGAQPGPGVGPSCAAAVAPQSTPQDP